MKTLNGAPLIVTKHGTVIVDQSVLDDELLDVFNWSIIPNGWGKRYCYGYNSLTKEKMMLSRFLLGLTKSDTQWFADHINGDTFDNRLCNLRIVTRSQNSQNMKKTGKQKTSQFKGVFWDKARNKWAAVVKYKQRRVCYLRCTDEIEAAWAYDFISYNLFGPYALLNFKEQV